MKKTGWLLLILGLAVNGVQAEMKCAPGKCASGKCGASMMQTEKKEIVSMVKKPVTIKAHTYRCALCNMSIDDPSHAAQALSHDGKVLFFDDIGCLVKWFEKHKNTGAVLYVFAQDTQQWIIAEKAWFAVTESTPMRYGFGAYENKKRGMIDFKILKERIDEGKTLRNPAVRKHLLAK
jgi:hypothetical protein